MGPVKTWKDGGVNCGGIVAGFMGEIGRTLGSGELLIRAALRGDIGPAATADASKPQGVIANAMGFVPDVAISQAIENHRAAKAHVDAMTGKEPSFNEACKVERMALNAVRAAHVSNLTEAATRAVYLEKYWRAVGDGEAENAWPYLSPAVSALAPFLP
jgi:hypothetical protein